jgi:hypothetical protein
MQAYLTALDLGVAFSPVLEKDDFLRELASRKDLGLFQTKILDHFERRLFGGTRIVSHSE